MPNNMKKMSKVKMAKQQRNIRTVQAAMDDEEALFGRTVKALGNCRFRVIVQDSKGRLNEEEARIGGRSVARIEINDIVIVARSGPKGVEILGKMDPKNASRLTKEKRLHPALLSAVELDGEKVKKLSAATAEEGFEFDYDGFEGAEADEDQAEDKPKGGAAAAVTEADDVCIDDI